MLQWVVRRRLHHRTPIYIYMCMHMDDVPKHSPPDEHPLHGTLNSKSNYGPKCLRQLEPPQMDFNSNFARFFKEAPLPSIM